MISAPLTHAADFSSHRQAEMHPLAQRPARHNNWLALIAQRVQRRKQAEADCLIH